MNQRLKPRQLSKPGFHATCRDQRAPLGGAIEGATDVATDVAIDANHDFRDTHPGPPSTSRDARLRLTHRRIPSPSSEAFRLSQPPNKRLNNEVDVRIGVGVLDCEASDMNMRFEKSGTAISSLVWSSSASTLLLGSLSTSAWS